MNIAAEEAFATNAGRSQGKNRLGYFSSETLPKIWTELVVILDRLCLRGSRRYGDRAIVTKAKRSRKGGDNSDSQTSRTTDFTNTLSERSECEERLFLAEKPRRDCLDRIHQL